MLAQDGRMFLDLFEANRRNLVRAGMAVNRIERAGLCTACRAELFFSHRRDQGKTGRQISLVMIK